MVQVSGFENVGEWGHNPQAPRFKNTRRNKCRAGLPALPTAPSDLTPSCGKCCHDRLGPSQAPEPAFVCKREHCPTSPSCERSVSAHWADVGATWLRVVSAIRPKRMPHGLPGDVPDASRPEEPSSVRAHPSSQLSLGHSGRPNWTSLCHQVPSPPLTAVGWTCGRQAWDPGSVSRFPGWRKNSTCHVAVSRQTYR